MCAECVLNVCGLCLVEIPTKPVTHFFWVEK